MKKFVFTILCITSLLCSCNNQDLTESASNEKKVTMIDAEVIHPSASRSEVGSDNVTEGYMCTSESSPLRLEVYPVVGLSYTAAAIAVCDGL